mmetsp:Transcript_45009/g.97754  ORF Transcript_45009/g.97754 Transcript_45009/m.97754 type:complete len:206 (-) Transcript_45009:191-808(-)|eukprot:CAMPEP_0170575326 /NCGR_PEP_ID=MMETSP0224-20130122/3804_1 /TAXON_ID=285029 /ORGANISM="Togula jolla, Strain CCCM 725" /LENGTH=205 /DNA_ID=CAMNT_0010898103 /DNA_START=62 /DNA_END=679 /DNA_ORIENTATION=+
MSRYWSDEAYSQFYNGSAPERRIVNKMVDGSGGGPTKAQLEVFQQAFAEWSSGRSMSSALNFRRCLAQAGVELSAQQATALWDDAVRDSGEDSQELGYDGALQAYLQVLDHPVEFRRPLGSAPPGIGAERTRRRKEVTSSQGGLSLSVSEARSFLLKEGLPAEPVEVLLCRFADRGVVPQAELFDFLTQHTCIVEDVAPSSHVDR